MEEIEEGEVISVTIIAKNSKGEGIGKVGESFIFIRNCNPKIGNEYKVRIIKKYRTYAIAEPEGEKNNLLIEKESFKNVNSQIK
ncbi:MAG: TRAM domain-containing protein [Candidatus Micrarchaeales archaeon]